MDHFISLLLLDPSISLDLYILQNVNVHAKEEENAYQIIITYIPDNDVLETNLEVYLERT